MPFKIREKRLRGNISVSITSLVVITGFRDREKRKELLQPAIELKVLVKLAEAASPVAAAAGHNRGRVLLLRVFDRCQTGRRSWPAATCMSTVRVSRVR
jgi:hypothetical protein